MHVFSSNVWECIWHVVSWTQRGGVEVSRHISQDLRSGASHATCLLPVLGSFFMWRLNFLLLIPCSPLVLLWNWCNIWGNWYLIECSVLHAACELYTGNDSNIIWISLTTGFSGTDAFTVSLNSHQGAVSIRKTVLPGMAIPMLKIRRPNGRLIFNMEIAIRR